MNEPHENLDRDPFADDAQRRPSRLARTAARAARRARRARCAAQPAPGMADRIAGRLELIRHSRPCPNAARGPLR